MRVPAEPTDPDLVLADCKRLLSHVYGVALPAVPDNVWEALQRLIENAATLGPASQEDALLVARWRGQFVAARESAAGVKEPSADKLLGDLLARIHRDGGHYVMEHGWQKAAEDAEAKVLADRRALALACFEDEGKIAFYVAAAKAEQADVSGVNAPVRKSALFELRERIAADRNAGVDTSDGGQR